MSDNLPDLNPSAVFERFRLRHQGFRWKPIGFPLGNQGARSLNEFQLEIQTNAAYTSSDRSSFNVKEGNVHFDFSYDPCRLEEAPIQMDQAAWAAITAGPLKDREFFLNPRDEAQLRAVLDDESFDPIAVVLCYPGLPIPGLTLAGGIRATSWEFFIPRESKEGRLVAAAIQLRREQRMQLGGDTTQSLSRSITGLIEALTQEFQPVMS